MWFQRNSSESPYFAGKFSKSICQANFYYLFFMLRRSPLFFALLLNLFFLVLYFAFGIVRHGSLDDYFMSSVLTGAYGGAYDVHTYFVGSAYGYFLKPFYWLFPKVGWYFIFELVGTFAAFTTFTYFLIQRMGTIMGVALSALLLASLTPDFYFQLSFTQCATIYTAAGILSFFFAHGNKRFLILGSLFLIAGSTMRWECFLLGMPYLAIYLVFQTIIKKTGRKAGLVALAICFATLYGLHTFDKNLYSSDDYKYYADYQPVRAFFGDGAYYDKESAFDELQERGMSGPDFRLLKNWMFYDTEVFARDSLLPIIDVAKNSLYTPNPSRMSVAFFMAVSRELTRSVGWCWAIFCIILLLSRSKLSNLYPWTSLGIIGISIGYLLLVNRLAYHVESGIWLYATVCGIFFMSADILDSNRFMVKWNKLIPLFLIALAAFFAYFGIAEQRTLKKQWQLIEHEQVPADWQEFLKYARDHNDDVFLLSFKKYKDLGTIRNPPYLSIDPGSWNNIFSWGYWNIHLPAMKQEFKKRGVDNPIHDIVHDNVYLLEDNNQPSLLDFYKRHYHDSLWVDTVKTFGDLMLLKYHSTNQQPGEGDAL